MSPDPLTVVVGVNLRMSVLLGKTRQALTGESVFGVDEVRALMEPIGQMEPIMKQAKSLRNENPEIGKQIDIYTAQLGCLRTTLVHVHMMLAGKRAQMEPTRRQLSAVSQWTNALQQIR
jgi:hypothetical protein